ncbi:fumarylacetoacetate hydrolase family protein [Chitinimonas lacunae]|uniref:Fumarylacetoacetate hydrolase family protein n=1 Tax=Chitinimonas lacunae TaxID=1963018 RepID=A0ABV8MUU5_9NEIS
MAHIRLQDRSTRPVANIYCIGRNYAAHAAELGNQVEEEPVVFLKPTSALLPEGEPIRLPAFSNDVHFETELVLLIGQGGKSIAPHAAWSHIEGYGLGLDLTARDLQTVAKRKGLPWTLAKGFDGAAVLSEFIPAAAVTDPTTLSFSLDIDGERRQRGEIARMVFDIPTLLAYLSSRFTLQAGDLIFTGTPEGVGPLHSGNRLLLQLDGHLEARFDVA